MPTMHLLRCVKRIRRPKSQTDFEEISDTPAVLKILTGKKGLKWIAGLRRPGGVCI